MAAPSLPKAQTPLLDVHGWAARDWYAFFQQLLNFANESGLLDPGVIAAIQERIAALEAADDATIAGPVSVQVLGSLANGGVNLQLRNDAKAPGNTYYYGTGPTGTKGWSTVASAFTQGDGIALTTGADGVTDIAHGDTSSVADLNQNSSGTVVLQDFAITFDAFGHVQTVAVGTVDVASALALTFQPLDGTLTALAAANWAANALPIGSGADTVAQVTFAANTFPARASTGNLVAKAITDFGLSLVDDADDAAARATLGAEPTLAAGTAAQFYRGDKTWSDTLAGTLTIAPAGSTGFIGDKYSDNNVGFQFRGVKSRGSEGAPSAALSGDTLFTLQGRAYHSGGATSGSIGAASLELVEDATSSAQGTRWTFSTVAPGTTSRDDRLIVTATDVSPGTTNTETLGTSSLVWAGVHTSAAYETGVVTPAQLTANTDNWAPNGGTGLAKIIVIRATTNASLNLTGIAGMAAGQRIVLINANTAANNLVLVHNATSTAANRFYCPGGVNLTLNAYDSALLWYDATDSRIRVLGF